MSLKNKLDRAWNSPTLMTWMSYFTKSASLLLVTPLILKKFTEIEIVIWYLFAAIISLSGIADLGFRNTFVRFFSYAKGGAIDIFFTKEKQNILNETNWDLVSKLFSHMKRIYLIISIVLLLTMLSLGSCSLISTISKAENTTYLWYSWILISISLCIDFYGKIYFNYLEGFNEIALVKRVESIFRVFVILGCFLVLTFYPSIFNLSLVISAGYIFNTIRNGVLAYKIQNGKIKDFTKHSTDKLFLKEIWKPAWKSGVSGLLGNGLLSVTSILYAQIGSTTVVATYMVTLRVITEIRTLSLAPFYSKIPQLSKLQVQGKQAEIVKLAKSGMKKSHMMFVIAVILAGISIQPFLNFIGSDVKFADPLMWILLSFGFYVHRYSAMHMQLYMTSNHIISHIADAISGVLFVGSAYLLIPFIGIYAIPVGMLVGYLCFYSWFAGYYSFKLIKTNFFEFEKDTSLPFASLLILFYLIYYFILN